MAKSPPKGCFRTPLLQSIAIADVSETGEKIGGGQHGLVSKGLWRGTPCAIKRLYLTPNASNYSAMVDRFERECKLLCSLRHPNIAQFLGVLSQGESDPPALLWELCPLSLAAVVEAHPGLPLHLQLSLMSDVAQGLAYLHCSLRSPVVHGSLTASNVLVSPALQAKLADLGVARIVDASKTPRTSAYLPPEALSSRPRYTPSVDVFSLGNLILHIVSRRWPVPSEPSRGLKSGVVEVERRRQYIDLMGPQHPLVNLVQLCLHSDPDQRPKTLSIVSQLCELSEKEHSQFRTLLDLLIGMERRESELLHTAEDVEKKREQLQSVTKQLTDRDTELAGLREQVRLLEEEVASHHTMKGLLQPPSASGRSTAVQNGPIGLKPTQSQFVWKRDAAMPVGMRCATAVLLDGKLYIGGGEAKEFTQERLVFEYDFDGLVRKWTCLPPSPTVYFTLVVFNKTLVLVGGADIASRRSSTHLISWDKESQEWSPSLPPMPTARQKAAAVSHNLMLLVAGGYANKRPLNTVELFDSSTFQWQGLKQLPIACCSPSSCVVHNQWYLLGGKLYGDSGAQAKFLTLDLTVEKLTHAEWSFLPDAPLTSSCAVACEHLVVAVGGSPPGSITPSKSVHVFLPSSQRWMYLCDMPTAHSSTAAVVATVGKLYVLGGKEESVRTVDYGMIVEVLSV